MKKTILLLLLLISVLVLVMRYSSLLLESVFGIRERAGISVLSRPEGATVYLDDTEVGKTPYEDKNLQPKVYSIKIEKDQLKWAGKVKLTDETLAIVSRDLAEDQTSSSGEILTLKKGRGMTVISNPSQSEVEIDGQSFGKSPQTVQLQPGEHTLLLSHPNYLKRSIHAKLPEGFNLTVSVDLALSEADLTTISTPTITTTPQVKVLDTPTGFLRVRDKASLLGKEIAQVKPADTLILLEELPGWFRIRSADGVEGYVSSPYAVKLLNSR